MYGKENKNPKLCLDRISCNSGSSGVCGITKTSKLIGLGCTRKNTFSLSPLVFLFIALGVSLAPLKLLFLRPSLGPGFLALGIITCNVLGSWAGGISLSLALSSRQITVGSAGRHFGDSELHFCWPWDVSGRARTDKAGGLGGAAPQLATRRRFSVAAVASIYIYIWGSK